MDIISNNNGFVFYKLLINDVSHFDQFVCGLEKLPKELKSLESIYAYMDMFSRIMLPKSKFRKIKNPDRGDIYEFKKNNVRVYIILQSPSIYVITGGLKNDQEKDVKRITKQVKNF